MKMISIAYGLWTTAECYITSSTFESLLQIQFRPSRMHEQHSIDNMIIDVILFSKHIL